MPERPVSQGKIHPVSQVIDEISSIFSEIGFSIEEGPDVENEYNNFTALNTPDNHPARDMHDTFYLDEKKKELKKIITSNKELFEYKDLITSIYFFGAGCNTPNSKNNIHFVLSSCFKKAISVVEDDIMSAVYATTLKPAVVVILVTGSNCCYFNTNICVVFDQFFN